MTPPRLRLFCLPHAGGSAAAFRRWPAGLPPTIEVCPVELPGRGERWLESPCTRIAPLVQRVVATLRPYLDQPFAIFGHSIGALVGFELARALRHEHSSTPVWLFVAAYPAPHLAHTLQPGHDLPDNELVERLRLLAGTHHDVLDQSELRELFLPVVRADFAVCDSYTYEAGPPLDCPISAFGGLQDPIVSRALLLPWQEHTRVGFGLRMLPDGHFFSRSEALLLQLLSHELRSLVPRVAS